jgi:plasmid maintenance system antidote protein VapI
MKKNNCEKYSLESILNPTISKEKSTIEEIAAYVGCRPSKLRSVIKNDTKLSVHDALALQDLLGISAETLLTRKIRAQLKSARASRQPLLSLDAHRRQNELTNELKKHPGEHIHINIKKYKMSVKGAARQLGWSVHKLKDSIYKKRIITEKDAEQLAFLFEQPTKKWTTIRAEWLKHRKIYKALK